MSGLDLASPLRVHVVGAGGTGMSAVATVLAEMGHTVSGSDLKESPTLERLRAAGVEVAVGHRRENVGDADVVVYSSAVPLSNIELDEAEARGIPAYVRGETLGAISRMRRTIAVAGTHGKTTTASMLALILVEAGMQPSFVIGGDLNEIGANAVWAQGEWLVVEADESDGSFLMLDADIVVVTSLEADHLEQYGSLDGLRGAFTELVAEARQAVVVSADDPGAAALAPEATVRTRTFGFDPGASYVISDFEGGRSESRFSLVDTGDSAGDSAGSGAGEDNGERPVHGFSLPMTGRHNVRNAAGATAAAIAAGAEIEAAQRALARFAGVARRFEFRGEIDGVTLVDDYAHLPGEVAAVLAAARLGGYGRIVCVFQPHRFSRTQSLHAEFADAFVDADVVAVTSIYPAGEEPRPGVSGKLVLDAVLEAHPAARAAYLPTRESILTWLAATLRPGDLCISLGAGDLTSLAEDLLRKATVGS